MIRVSDPIPTAPRQYGNELQFLVYQTLLRLRIPFQRVETDEVITMEDCKAINERLSMHMVKTLFLCTRHQQELFLFVTTGEKRFDGKAFAAALGTTRISFASKESMKEILGTEVGAATIFSTLLQSAHAVQVVIDADILEEEYFGCSDGTTTGYLKLRTQDVLETFLPSTGHGCRVISIGGGVG